jgi:aryl-alcohol dehydrogenase-like predicted oxidoreductase
MIKQIKFGRTGHASSRVLLGAAAFWSVSQDQADASIELALAKGVNHIDVAASYGDAELRVGSWIKRHGKSFFLATKTGERTKEKAREELLRSLERLQVEKVDLLQLHNLVDPQEWETALGDGGALEAAIEAREEGLVRFLGVTGHGLTVPAMHLNALERFDFDSVLLPYNFLLEKNASYNEVFWKLVNVCKERGVAVQIIKSLARSPWGDTPQTRTTWYRPFEQQSDIDLAVHWVLGNEGFFLNSAGDTDLLPKVLDAAERFTEKPAETLMADRMKELGMEPLFLS